MLTLLRSALTLTVGDPPSQIHGWFPLGPYYGAHCVPSLLLLIVICLLTVSYYQSAPELSQSVEEHTERGWAGLRRDKLDVTDGAWASFRGHLPLLVAVATLQLVGKALFVAVTGLSDGRAVLAYKAVFGAVLWTAVFGRNVALVLAWVGAAYALAPRASDGGIVPRLRIGVAWVFNCAALYSMDVLVLPAPLEAALSALLEPLGLADGLLSWTNVGYFLALRCLSFALDMHDVMCKVRGQGASGARFSRPDEYEQLPAPQQCGAVAFLAYALYPPLFLAGPIMRFADFARQHRRTESRVGSCASEEELAPVHLLRYCLRFAVLYVVFEALQYAFYPSAVVAYATSTAAGAPQLRPPGGISFAVPMSWLMLTFTWCKFTLVWRFFRMWAMLDGVLPREDVTRCMSDNCSIKGFWKNFHATYNQWLVRYVLVPLGGSHGVGLATLARNAVAAFGFVLFTHDRNFTHLDKYPWWFGIFVSAFVAEATLDAHISAWHRRGTPTPSVVALRCVVGAATILVLFLGNMLTYGFESGSAGVRFLLGGGDGGWDAVGIVAGAGYFYGIVACVYCQQLTRNAIERCPVAAAMVSIDAPSDSPPRHGRAAAAPLLQAALGAPARALGTTPARLLAACAYVALVVGPAIGAACALDGSAWDGLRFKSPHVRIEHYFNAEAQKDVLSASSPTEYEACELVRFGAYVRAPSNAWSSVAFLLAPIITILFSSAGRFDALAAAATGCVAGAAPALGVQAAVLLALQLGSAAFIFWGSFLYHASVTDEMNYIDVRAMFVALGIAALKDVLTLAQRHRVGGEGGALRWTLFLAAVSAWNLTALFTDFLSHRFTMIMPPLFVWIVGFELRRASRHFGAGGDEAARRLRRSRARHALASAALLMLGLVFKVVDDLKVLCTTPGARTSLLQLTAAFHVLFGIGMALKSKLEGDEYCEGEGEGGSHDD